MKRVWIGCALVALLLCVPASASWSEPPPVPTSWVGHTQQELIAALGDPATIRVRPDGTVLLEYIVERNGLTCHTVYLALPTGRIAAQKDDCV